MASNGFFSGCCRSNRAVVGGVFGIVLTVFGAFSAGTPAWAGGTSSTDEVALGEQLFLDPRFSQVFERGPLPANSEDLQLQAIGSGRAGTSCASCHFIDQQDEVPGKGPRAYSDFEVRSTIPDRGDGQTTTLRNSPTLVEFLAAETAAGESLTHFDGEFSKVEDLVIAGFTGRNFGWLAAERGAAIQHLARVIREDSAYRESFRLPVDSLPDSVLLEEAARLVAVYLRDLRFIRDSDGRFAGSAYDEFLRVNALPREPDAGEVPLEYARRLRKALQERKRFEFIGQEEASGMARHAQLFRFGPEELRGLQVFLSESSASEGSASGGVGQCLRCHAPPLFTDLRFHSIGIAQRDQDRKEGLGTFQAWVESEGWRSPRPAEIGRDYGVWHVLAREADPRVRRARELLSTSLCDSLQDEGEAAASCTSERLLRASVGRFKTPTLRNLGHNAPFFHDGSSPQLQSAVTHYMGFSELARRGKVPGASAHLQNIHLTGRDVIALTRFLESLNEDYD
jgi:cytochrome c peroxidase